MRAPPANLICVAFEIKTRKGAERSREMIEKGRSNKKKGRRTICAALAVVPETCRQLRCSAFVFQTGSSIGRRPTFGPQH